MGSVAIKATALQQLLEDGRGVGVGQPDTPWDIRNSAPKFRQPETVAIRLTELQQLLEDQPDGGLSLNLPASLWNIRESAPKFVAGQKTTPQQPETVTIRTTDLQKLQAAAAPGDDVRRPAAAWDIRAGSDRFRAAAGVAGGREIKLTDLQKLFEANGIDIRQPASLWNIREAAQQFRERANLASWGGAKWLTWLLLITHGSSGSTLSLVGCFNREIVVLAAE